MANYGMSIGPGQSIVTIDGRRYLHDYNEGSSLDITDLPEWQPQVNSQVAAQIDLPNQEWYRQGKLREAEQAAADNDFDWGNLIDTAIKGAATGMIGYGALGELSSLSDLFGGGNAGTAGLVDAGGLEGIGNIDFSTGLPTPDPSWGVNPATLPDFKGSLNLSNLSQP